MWLQMGAVLDIIVKHANNVHDELQQLSLEVLSLFQRCIVRGKLQNSKILILAHLRHTFAWYFMYRNILSTVRSPNVLSTVVGKCQYRLNSCH